MPGRLMSMSTTSGFSRGTFSNAASALACWPRQVKPSARSRTRASVPRNWSLSSTMETVIGMTSTFVADFRPERCGQADDRAAFRRRVGSESAAHILHPLAHVAQSISALVARVRWQTAPVVLDFKDELISVQPEADLYRTGVRVPDHVVDGFLEREEHVVPYLGRNRRQRQFVRRIQPVA